MYTPTEVANLELTVNTKQEVLGFDIAVDNVFRMQVRKSVRHLIDVDRAPAFGERTRLVELLIQLALAGEFDHEENPLLVVEIAIQPENIRVPQVLLDLNLAADLFLDTLLHDFRLVQALEGQDVPWLALRAHHVDAPKPAFTKWPPNIEVIQVPLLCRTCTANTIELQSSSVFE